MRAGKDYEIWHIKDEDRFYGSLNEGALIYINSHSKAFYNKLGLAYGQGVGNLSANWNQDFYIYRNGYFYEQVGTQSLIRSSRGHRTSIKDDWKLPAPAGGGLTFSGLAHWKDEETEIMKNLNYFIENYEVLRIFDDEKRCLDILKKLLMSLKDDKNPAYMKPIYVHFLGSGVNESSLGINESEAQYIENWCESMSYQGFNIRVKYHYMKTPQIMRSEDFYVFRDGSGPYPKKFQPTYY
jgi:hypothetical protein